MELISDVSRRHGMRQAIILNITMGAMATYLSSSDIFFEEGCSRLLQRVEKQGKRRRRISQVEQFGYEEQIMRPPMGQVDWGHGALSTRLEWLLSWCREMRMRWG